MPPAQVLLVLGLAYGGLRSSALSQATASPLFRMVIGLGLACGVLGYVAVGKLGGNPDVWLLHWEVRRCIYIRLAGSLPRRGCGQLTAGDSVNIGLTAQTWTRAAH